VEETAVQPKADDAKEKQEEAQAAEEAEEEEQARRIWARGLPKRAEGVSELLPNGLCPW
jgi:hypothetical protein